MNLRINEIIKLFHNSETRIVDRIQKFCDIAGISDWNKFKKSNSKKVFFSKKLNCNIKVVGDKCKEFGWTCSEIEYVLTKNKDIKKINTVKNLFEGVVLTNY